MNTDLWCLRQLIFLRFCCVVLPWESLSYYCVGIFCTMPDSPILACWWFWVLWEEHSSGVFSLISTLITISESQQTLCWDGVDMPIIFTKYNSSELLNIASTCPFTHTYMYFMSFSVTMWGSQQGNGYWIACYQRNCFVTWSKLLKKMYSILIQPLLTACFLLFTLFFFNYTINAYFILSPFLVLYNLYLHLFQLIL